MRTFGGSGGSFFKFVGDDEKKSDFLEMTTDGVGVTLGGRYA